MGPSWAVRSLGDYSGLGVMRDCEQEPSEGGGVELGCLGLSWIRTLVVLLQFRLSRTRILRLTPCGCIHIMLILHTSWTHPSRGKLT